MLNEHRLWRILLNSVTYFPFHFWDCEICSLDPKKTYINVCWANYITIERGCYFALHRIKNCFVKQEFVSLEILSLLQSAFRKWLGMYYTSSAFLYFWFWYLNICNWKHTHHSILNPKWISTLIHQKLSMKVWTNVLKVGFDPLSLVFWWASCCIMTSLGIYLDQAMVGS